MVDLDDDLSLDGDWVETSSEGEDPDYNPEDDLPLQLREAYGETYNHYIIRPHIREEVERMRRTGNFELAWYYRTFQFFCWILFPRRFFPPKILIVVIAFVVIWEIIHNIIYSSYILSVLGLCFIVILVYEKIRRAFF